MIGIYRFVNKINNQSYIGQSIHIEQRYKEHLNEIKNTRRNTKWYQAVRKYGIENFNFEILEECKANELNEREIYWISYYDAYKNGYNSTPGGQESYYDPQLIFDAWDSGLTVSDISEKLKISTSSIYNNLQGYYNYSVQESNRRGGIKASQTAGKKIKTNKIYQYDLDGNFIKEWPSCKEIARVCSYDASLIGKCRQGHRKSAYGYQWKPYKKDKIDAYI